MSTVPGCGRSHRWPQGGRSGPSRPQSRRQQGKFDPTTPTGRPGRPSGRADGTPKTRDGAVEMIRRCACRHSAVKARRWPSPAEGPHQDRPRTLAHELRDLDGAELLGRCRGCGRPGSGPVPSPSPSATTAGDPSDPTAACKRALSSLARRTPICERDRRPRRRPRATGRWHRPDVAGPLRRRSDSPASCSPPPATTRTSRSESASPTSRRRPIRLSGRTNRHVSIAVGPYATTLWRIAMTGSATTRPHRTGTTGKEQKTTRRSCAVQALIAGRSTSLAISLGMNR